MKIATQFAELKQRLIDEGFAAETDWEYVAKGRRLRYISLDTEISMYKYLLDLKGKATPGDPKLI